MRTRFPIETALCACILASLFAACAGQESPINVDTGGITSAPVTPGTTTSKQDLLYVSDESTNDVYVYTYPQGVLTQTLTGFSTPQGECADAHQDVYITEFSPPHIVEYQHGGTSALKTLVDPDMYPIACAVDSVTGNLAVGNFRHAGGGPGSVSIFNGATGTPTVFSYPDVLISVFALAYDDKGNLFIDGFNPNGDFALAELAKGAPKFKRLRLNQKIGYPGGVQFDGKYVVVGDEATPIVYQFKIRGKRAKKVGSMSLASSNEVFQFFILRQKSSSNGASLIAPSLYPPSVEFYPYPAGGTATKTITGQVMPLGVVVSKGQ